MIIETCPNSVLWKMSLPNFQLPIVNLEGEIDREHAILATHPTNLLILIGQLDHVLLMFFKYNERREGSDPVVSWVFLFGFGFEK